MTPDALIQAFAQPDANHRPMPQWSWNGQLTRQRITEQLEQFSRQGAGGLFPHARPGLVTPYLSDEWFAMWRHGLLEAQRLGLQWHIYDEFTCPGGYAGGHVVARKPHLGLQALSLTLVPMPTLRPAGEVLAWFRHDRSTGSLEAVGADAVAAASSEAPLLALVLQAAAHRPEKGNFALPDMLRRETADTFIETTHERYAAVGGDHFGKTVRFVFCDEPEVHGPRDAWPFSHHLVREFRHDHGYELTDRLGELCFELGEASAVRFDFWWTVNRLFNQNFMKPLHDWCAQHNLMLTGHLMEHLWPSPRPHPSAMASLRWMQAPGNDLLGFQFKATTPADNAIYFMNLKEISSLAAQLGRRWVVTESTGGAGYNAAYDVFKPIEDYLLALGVNVMDPHLAHYSIAGGRKYDWAHTLSDHSPWWPYYRRHADHVARANTALDAGQEHNRVLVLQPTTTAWLHYAPKPFRLTAGPDPLDALQAGHTGLLVQLYSAQVDFDLGDEFILDEFARAEAGRLTVGERSYELLVVPPTMENLTRSTLKLLEACLAGGGRVVSGQALPTHVDGRPDEAPADLAHQYAAQWTRTQDPASLVRTVRAAVKPYIAAPDGEPLPAELCWRRTRLGDGGLVYFFCNPWEREIRTRVRLEDATITELRTDTGEAFAVDVHGQAGQAIAELHLPPGGHVLWLCGARSPAEARPVPARDAAAVPLRPEGIERLRENILVLDYCRLQAEGHTLECVNTAQADEANWRLQGIGVTPWEFAHAFNRTAIDRPLPGDSGMTVTYRFEVDAGLPEAARASLRLAVERPWLYRITVNGRHVESDSGERWLDDEIRALPIGPCVQAGANEVTLSAQPFHMLAEIMPAYLLGEFSLVGAERGFRVGPPRPLELGDWSAQGSPFYHDAVRYRFGFKLSAPAQSLRVQGGRWRGSVMALSLDGESQGVLYPHEASLDLTGPVGAGRYELALDVIGSMQSLMGPHHAKGLPIAWTWANAPVPQPAGEAYRTFPAGLLAPPELFALNAR